MACGFLDVWTVRSSSQPCRMSLGDQQLTAPHSMEDIGQATTPVTLSAKPEEKRDPLPPPSLPRGSLGGLGEDQKT